VSKINILVMGILASVIYTISAYSAEISRMHITSDTSRYNYKMGETWFEGSVQVDQGTTHLTADRVVTHKNEHNKIIEAVAYGDEKPVHYWSRPLKHEKEIHAQARMMKFYPLESKVVLEGNVIVVQGENRFQGQIIVYNIKQQTITVPPSKNSRATFVIEANEIKQLL
jgi:lipopolysaccharide export system protein LptA